MNIFQTTLLIFFFALNTVLGFGQNKQSKPNVIVIMTDDMGYGDMGIHGNDLIQTPVLDKLAKESVEFSNFYVSPVCAPTRASLMTGRYHTRTGVYDTYSGGAIMATEEVTMAEVFAEAEYKTGLFGKWHLGDSYPFRPQDQGFAHSVWHLSGGIGQVGDVFNYYQGDRSYFDPTLYKNGEVYKSKGYCSDVYTDEAISFVRNNLDTNFFLYLSFNAPHTPLQVPDSYYERYKDLEIDEEHFRKNGTYTHDMSERDKEDARKVYAMVTNIDDNIGRLIKVLKKEGVYDNTIIVFLTDNGPQQYRYVGGYRGLKGQVREGGIHVPFYLKPTGKMKTTAGISTPAAHIDLLPTLSDLCDISIPDQLELDGVSLRNEILNTGKIDDRSLFFEWQRSYPEKYRNMTVISDGYKLIGNTGSDGHNPVFELYDLNKDPFESTDLSDQDKVRVNTMTQQLDGWYESIMDSPHIKNSQRIIVGSEKERHTILNRNDAKGLPLIWDQDGIYVRWDLEVIDKGPYKILVHFREPLESSGELVVRIGRQHLTKKIAEPATQTIEFSNVELYPGEHELESWYYVRWKEHFTPFYIELIHANAPK